MECGGSSPLFRRSAPSIRIALLSLLTLLTVTIAAPAQDDSRARQVQTLDWLRRTLPQSSAWEAWLTGTHELPPDFEALPGNPALPDPLLFADGRRVSTAEQWPSRRAELLQLFQHYIVGSCPPPPGNVRVAESREMVESGAMVREVTLEFGPDHRARLHLELIRPTGPGPFPVFITQTNHRRWALVAVSRGYLACVYAGADVQDDTGAWREVWPEAEWTKLTRRAWAASRCIDYLETLPDVDRQHFALTGHSRNGKTSLIAAAFDERIAAVISSSSGAGGSCSWRFFSESQFGEGIELITRHFPDWLHPRLRFFTGREDRLPIDQHELIACIAPRAVLISTAFNDNVESVWAVEQTTHAAAPVFELLRAPGQLNLRYRPGPHATKAGDIESYLDWLDGKFGRGTVAVDDRPVFPTYRDWLRAVPDPFEPEDYPERRAGDLLTGPDGKELSAAAWPNRRTDLVRAIDQLLGAAPPGASDPSGSYGAEPGPIATLLGRQNVPSRLVKESLSFGNYLAGDLYYPTNIQGTDRKLPAFLWLHPISVSNGYVAGYHRGEAPHLALTRSGYAVFAFDQIGHGSRIEEVRHFYTRYPRWSLLGKMIADARAAVDALQQHAHVDPHQIYAVGYGMGSLVALHVAALDPRIAGTITVGGVTPMRASHSEPGTGAVARYSTWLPLIPRLGSFLGHEARIPYDVPELLALVAPRPTLLIVPGVDYQTDLEALRRAVGEARKVYGLLGSPQGLVLQKTDDYHHFAPELVWCLCGTETLP